MRSSFAELINAWLKDPAGTRAKWNGPVLVQRLTTAGSDKDDGGPTRAAFVMSRPEASEARVHLIAKSGKPNAFPMGVTIGRVGGNDIELDDNSISRFHAWLQQDERTKAWALTDAESKNGTWVAGAELAPRQRVPLTDQTEIRLGNVFLTFLLPASLWALVLANPLAKP
ncbi:MAG: FHA domain-containing protein [Archangium sp.]|nr:FHA domain-containing protein [Archangium sp.]